MKMRPRVMPCLLVSDSSLVKPVRFKDPAYIGDPLNAIKIFNDKEVDELILLDIKASSLNEDPKYDFIRIMAESCFMPLCYGGGIENVEQAKLIFNSGVEKISLYSVIPKKPELITEIAKIYGSQSVVASIDVKRNVFGKYTVHVESGTTPIKIDLLSYIKMIENAGIGEILITAMDKEGTWSGYDLDLINLISSSVKVPVIANGGAGTIHDFKMAYDAGASAFAASSMFVYQKKDMGVLINFPSSNDLDSLLME